MRLIFINRFFSPDEPATAQLLGDLTAALARAGHRVAVVSSLPRGEKPGDANLENGVEVHRVPMSRLGGSNLAARAFDFAMFLRHVRSRLLALAQPGNILVPMTDPPLLGVVVDAVARRRNARCLHWVQDIFPEIAVALSTAGAARGVAASTRPARDRAWQRAAAIVAPGEDMAAFIAGTGIARGKIEVISNWAPHGIRPQPRSSTLRETWGVAGRFVVAYSGNFGRVHEILPLAALAQALADDPRFAFVFVGGGAGRAPLEEAVRSSGLTNVQFRPPQPRALLVDSLAVGDLQCVTLKASCAKLVFPSKLYGIAAAGRPVLLLGPAGCEVARIVRERRIGFAFEPHQIGEAAAALRQLASDPPAWSRLGEAAASYAASDGSLDHAVAGWNRLLSGIARDNR